MGRLLLIRHGQSIWNRDGICQGQAGPGLADRGHEQAEHLGRWLAGEADDDAAFVSSDLERCRETAAPFAELLGRAPDLSEDLRERHFGEWQGIPHAELLDHDPTLVERHYAGEDVIGQAGGESTPVLVDRVVPRLRVLAKGAPVTVVVTHGGPIWHGTHALLDVGEGVLGPVSNAAVTVLDVEDDHTTLLAWNQVGHLPRELRTTWPTPA